MHDAPAAAAAIQLCTSISRFPAPVRQTHEYLPGATRTHRSFFRFSVRIALWKLADLCPSCKLNSKLPHSSYSFFFLVISLYAVRWTDDRIRERCSRIYASKIAIDTRAPRIYDIQFLSRIRGRKFRNEYLLEEIQHWTIFNSSEETLGEFIFVSEQYQVFWYVYIARFTIIAWFVGWAVLFFGLIWGKYDLFLPFLFRQLEW